MSWRLKGWMCGSLGWMYGWIYGSLGMDGWMDDVDGRRWRSCYPIVHHCDIALIGSLAVTLLLLTLRPFICLSSRHHMVLNYCIMNPSNLLRFVFLRCFVLFDVPAFAFVLPLVLRGKQHTRTVARTAHDVKTHAEDEQQPDCSIPSRRSLLVGTAVALMTVSVTPQLSRARYMIDEETGECVQVEDVDWQTESFARHLVS